MDSEATVKLIQLFYETPRAQEIYTSLRKQREDARRANIELSFIDIPDEMEDKVTSLFIKQEKDIDAPPDERRQDIEEKFEESLCNCDEAIISETVLSECESKVSEVFQNVEKYYSVLQEEQKQRELLKWSLKIVNDKEIIVEGQRSGDPPDISWRTSVICDRISTNVVRSIKGTLYFLLGEINENDMIEKGFSEEIINMFKYGFPPNWRDLFAKALSNQREYKGHNEKKTPVMTKDITNRILDEETNAVYNMDDEATWRSDKLPNRTYSSRNTGTKNSAKTKTSSSSSGPRKRDRKTKLKHSNTTATNDDREIEVQRSRSGRLICPVLDYWRGQRIATSPCDDGEISIIKSNLEEDSRLMLVQTSRNSSGLLQTPTISSSAPTSETNTSETEWVPDSSKSDSTVSKTTNPQKRKSASLQAESQTDAATGSDTDDVEQEKTKSLNRKKSEKEARTMSISRNRNQSDKMSESETSAFDQYISKSSSRRKSERITKTAKSNTNETNSIRKRSTNNMTKIYPQRTSTRVDEARDSDDPGVVDQIKLNTKSTTGEMKRSYPVKTRIRFDDVKDTHTNSARQRNFSEKSGSKTYPTKPTTQFIANGNDTEGSVVKHTKSTSSSRRQLKQSISESQTQNSKKLNVQTGKLTSKTGTLARKRELRDMLEQQDEGYEDDAFEGTPFRSQKLSRMHKVSPVDIANSVDVPDDVPDDIHDNGYKTPRSRTPMNRLRPAGPLSTGKSEIDIMTPGLLNTVNRDNVDRYVNQLKRQKLRNIRKKVESHTPLGKKPSNNGMTGDIDYSFNIHKVTAIDDEEDKDFYWSDNE